MPIRGAYLQQSHDFMESRRVLLPLRTISAPADCTCPRTGSGRNRYVASTEGQRNAAPPHNPVRRSYPRDVATTSSYAAKRPFYGISTRSYGCNFAAQNCKPCLSVAANKSCLIGWPYIIWSCGLAPYGNGTQVCAASMGWVLQPAPGAASILTMGQRRCFGMVAPVFSINYIFACWHETKNGADGTLAPRPRMFLAKGNESHKHNRQSGQQKHRITKGSNSTDGGTAVTSPLYSTTGGTELRLFLSSTNQSLSIYEPPRRKGKATGLRGGFSPGPIFMCAIASILCSCRTEAAPIFDTPSKNLYYHANQRPGPRSVRRFGARYFEV